MNSFIVLTDIESADLLINVSEIEFIKEEGVGVEITTTVWMKSKAHHVVTESLGDIIKEMTR